MITRKLFPLLALTALVMLVAFPAFGLAQDATPTCAGCVPFEDGTGCLPLAPASQRVDTATPTFSNPTAVTNPLFPVSATNIRSCCSVRSTARTSEPRSRCSRDQIIEWHGQQIEVLVSQYAAYLDGRIHEVAYDFYAQADDGAVWYFGEDVFNFEDGVIADTHGTWIAGKDGPAGMIMPADPQVGDVYRPENIPGFVFEEVTVAKAVGRTLDGPSRSGRGRHRRHRTPPGRRDGRQDLRSRLRTSSSPVVAAISKPSPSPSPPTRSSGPPPAELTTLSTPRRRVLRRRRLRRLDHLLRVPPNR